MKHGRRTAVGLLLIGRAELAASKMQDAAGELRSKSRTSNQENPDIGAQFMLHMAIRLAQETLRTAAHSGAPEFFPGGKADLARNAAIAQDIEDHPASHDGSALLIDVLKVAAPLDHLGARQCVSFFHIAKKEVTRGDL